MHAIVISLNEYGLDVWKAILIVQSLASDCYEGQALRQRVSMKNAFPFKKDVYSGRAFPMQARRPKTLVFG